MRFSFGVVLGLIAALGFSGSVSALSLFPQEMYQIQNLSLPQLRQQLSLHVNQILNSGPAQSQETLLQNISQYWQGGVPADSSIEAILKETNTDQRSQMVDQWYLAKESMSLASDVKSYSEKTLVWKKSIRGGYLAPKSSPHARELAVHLLLTMKPQGYMHVLERYAAFPDDGSQGKLIMMRELRHQWDQKETFNIYKKVSESSANGQLKLMADRELLLHSQTLSLYK